MFIGNVEDVGASLVGRRNSTPYPLFHDGRHKADKPQNGLFDTGKFDDEAGNARYAVFKKFPEQGVVNPGGYLAFVGGCL